MWPPQLDCTLLHHRIRSSLNPVCEKFIWEDKIRTITMEAFWSTAQKVAACTKSHEHLRPQHGNGNSLLHERQITSTFSGKYVPNVVQVFLMIAFRLFVLLHFIIIWKTLQILTDQFKDRFCSITSLVMNEALKLFHGLKFQAVWKFWNHCALL